MYSSLSQTYLATGSFHVPIKHFLPLEELQSYRAPGGMWCSETRDSALFISVAHPVTQKETLFIF